MCFHGLCNCRLSSKLRVMFKAPVRAAASSEPMLGGKSLELASSLLRGVKNATFVSYVVIL